MITITLQAQKLRKLKNVAQKLIYHVTVAFHKIPESPVENHEKHALTVATFFWRF